MRNCTAEPSLDLVKQATLPSFLTLSHVCVLLTHLWSYLQLALRVKAEVQILIQSLPPFKSTPRLLRSRYMGRDLPGGPDSVESLSHPQLVHSHVFVSGEIHWPTAQSGLSLPLGVLPSTDALCKALVHTLHLMRCHSCLGKGCEKSSVEFHKIFTHPKQNTGLCNTQD